MGLYICVICGRKYGSPRSSVSTWYPGRCDYCGEDTNVTEARDWNYPKLPEERMHGNKDS